MSFALRRLLVTQLALLLVAVVCAAEQAEQHTQGQRTLPALQGGRRLKDELQSFEGLLSKYYSNEEMEEWLKTYSLRCQRISRLFSIGQSVEGRELWVLEISDKPGQQEAEPSFKYVANMHGDEPTGRQLLMALAEWLCQNYVSDRRAHTLVHHVHLYLLPSMNPDGFAAHKRENKNGKDLNRNFPDPIYDRVLAAKGDEQPETQAIMNWTLATHFTASASMHEGALVANYPWDGTKDRRTHYNASHDDAAFLHLAKAYASAHSSMHKSKEFKHGVTNGAAWYPVYGGMQDWNYLAGRCMDWTLELSEKKWPPADRLAELWRDNMDALLSFPQLATLGGIRGTVRDHTTGLPLAASVTVAGIPFNHTAREGLGDFYRPLAPGKYSVTISHPGYVPQTAEVQVPGDGSGVAALFHLESKGSPPDNESERSLPDNHARADPTVHRARRKSLRAGGDSSLYAEGEDWQDDGELHSDAGPRKGGVALYFAEGAMCLLVLAQVGIAFQWRSGMRKHRDGKGAMLRGA